MPATDYPPHPGLLWNWICALSTFGLARISSSPFLSALFNLFLCARVVCTLAPVLQRLRLGMASRGSLWRCRACFFRNPVGQGCCGQCGSAFIPNLRQILSQERAQPYFTPMWGKGIGWDGKAVEGKGKGAFLERGKGTERVGTLARAMYLPLPTPFPFPHLVVATAMEQCPKHRSLPLGGERPTKRLLGPPKTLHLQRVWRRE